MENNEIMEPVGNPAENEPKTYTQEQVDQIVKDTVNQRLDEVIPGRLARQEARINRQHQEKYGPLMNVLKAMTGKESEEDITQELRRVAKQSGKTIPEQKPQYSQKDVGILADADAAEIIAEGDEAVAEELKALEGKGIEQMSAREKARYQKLASHHESAERRKALAKMGVGNDVIDSSEFKSFAAHFDRNTPVEKVYEIFRKTQPQEEVKPLGSMKHDTTPTVKDYYSPEEIARMDDELDDPAVWAAVRRSMTGG